MLDFLNKLPHDKALHGFYGLIIFCVLSIYMDNGISFIITALIAGGKEVYDKYMPNHTSDIKDFVATVATPFILILLQEGAR